MNTAPIVSLTRKFSFCAAHRLNNPKLTSEENIKIYGKCNNEHGHGHNYNVSVTLKGPVDPKTGMVYNLQDLKDIIQEVSELVDHKNLDKEVDFFSTNISTTENLSIYLWNEIKSRITERPQLLQKLTVQETDKNKFKYKGQML